jgi:hypothetical protein
MLSRVDNDERWVVGNAELLLELGLGSDSGPEPAPLLALVNIDHVAKELESIVSAGSLIVENVGKESDNADLNICYYFLIIIIDNIY